jgi:hypothetical protein
MAARLNYTVTEVKANGEALLIARVLGSDDAQTIGRAIAAVSPKGRVIMVETSRELIASYKGEVEGVNFA